MSIEWQQATRQKRLALAIAAALADAGFAGQLGECLTLAGQLAVMVEEERCSQRFAYRFSAGGHLETHFTQKLKQLFQDCEVSWNHPAGRLLPREAYRAAARASADYAAACRILDWAPWTNPERMACYAASYAREGEKAGGGVKHVGAVALNYPPGMELLAALGWQAAIERVTARRLAAARAQATPDNQGGPP